MNGLPKEDAKNFKGSGEMMRHLKFESLKEIDETKIIELLKLVRQKSKIVKHGK